MKVQETNLKGLYLITPEVFFDDRGFFLESFNHSKFTDATGTEFTFVQDNHSRSSKGVLRGMHYQVPPFEQGKLVRVISGKVLDAVIDLRKNSGTFGNWYTTELSSENFKQLWIPPGFAHGFLTLSDTAELLYKTSNFYSKGHERSIAWNDSEINIDWGQVEEPIVSAKDKEANSFRESEHFD